MTTRGFTCPTCGQPVSPSVGECLYCSAEGHPAKLQPPSAQPARPRPPPTAPEAMPTPPPPSAAPGLPAAPPMLAELGPRQRALGLLLFEAEENLARGQGDKALVLASRAVKDQPESITARSLYERARRDVLKGRRRERLESRVLEAHGLLERGEYDGAERIVTSALKLIPDHAVALSLFSRLKERRLSQGTAEAEAERELDRLAREQASQTLAAARAHLAAGRERTAILTVRQGLRLAPDHPQLLAMLGDLQSAWTKIEADAARRRALHAQVRLGLDLLTRGQLDESLRILRAVLVEDPGHARAQSAIQEVRQEWLRRQSVPAGVSLPAPQPAPRPAAPAAGPAPEPRTPVPAAPGPAPGSPLPRREPLTMAPMRQPLATVSEVLLPRTRRKRTPWGLIFGAAGLVFVLLVAFTTWNSPPKAPLANPLPLPSTRHAEGLPPTTTEPPGPLTNLVPELRGVIEATLAAYAKALESRDASLLARARPDLSPAKREKLLAPLKGALNVATDLRVLDVIPQGRVVLVPVLRTDVIVGGRGRRRPPVEETLRFEWRGGVWVLRQSP